MLTIIAGGGTGNLFQGTNTFEFRNGTTAQTLYIYLTYTDASNYERIAIRPNVVAGIPGITYEALGTGSSRGFGAFGGAGNNYYFGGAQLAQWGVQFDGLLYPVADNLRDIGSNAQRLKSVYTSNFIKTSPKAISALTPAATAGAGARDMVNDALTPAFNMTVVAGGAVTVPVFSDGSAWKVG
jgi:hypothetical protein